MATAYITVRIDFDWDNPTVSLEDAKEDAIEQVMTAATEATNKKPLATIAINDVAFCGENEF